MNFKYRYKIYNDRHQCCGSGILDPISGSGAFLPPESGTIFSASGISLLFDFRDFFLKP
jgi:hypothetical protein